MQHIQVDVAQSHEAYIPGPRAAFGCMKEHRVPGMFPHVHDIKGYLNMSDMGLRAARAKVLTTRIWLLGGDCHTHQVLNV